MYLAKDIYPTYIKNSYKSMNKKTGQEKKNILTKRDLQIVYTFMERHSTLLVLKEIQIKTTKRYSNTHTRIADVKDSKEATS